MYKEFVLATLTVGTFYTSTLNPSSHVGYDFLWFLNFVSNILKLIANTWSTTVSSVPKINHFIYTVLKEKTSKFLLMMSLKWRLNRPGGWDSIKRKVPLRKLENPPFMLKFSYKPARAVPVHLFLSFCYSAKSGLMDSFNRRAVLQFIKRKDRQHQPTKGQRREKSRWASSPETG